MPNYIASATVLLPASPARATVADACGTPFSPNRRHTSAQRGFGSVSSSN
jgi:hypothetical protein